MESGKRALSVDGKYLSSRRVHAAALTDFVIPAQAGIQVTDNVRHTGEGRYPGVVAGISLDTRLRGYDGGWRRLNGQVSHSQIFSQGNTKGSDNCFSNFRVLHVLRGEHSFRSVRQRLLCGAIAFLALLLTHALPSSSFAASANNIRIGYPQPSGAMLPIWVMAETKLDQKYGVDLQNIYISGGARLTQTLVSGDIELAATGGAVINAVLSGADITYVAASVPTYGFSLYVRNDVKDVPSLKGKVVGLMTKGASTDHGLTALLRQYNLRSGQDVKVLYLGGVREGLAALDRGIVSATTISAPTTLMARRMGYKELVNFINLKIPYIQLGIVAHKAFLRQQPERMKAFLRGYVAAIKVVNEDADTSKRALAKYLATNDAAILDEAYQAYRGIYPRVPYTTEEQVRSILAVADHPKAAGADPKEFFDNRLLKEIDDSGFITELYGRR